MRLDEDRSCSVVIQVAAKAAHQGQGQHNDGSGFGW
jgi:hypothetical protein